VRAMILLVSEQLRDPDNGGFNLWRARWDL
jgi:hypothetical protein